MRLTRIHIRGYKRLADASCNVDGRLIALVGPNEAGKSSVLGALAWFSDRDSGPLPAPSQTRSLPGPSDTAPVVEAKFALDEDDLASLVDLPTDDVAKTVTILKMANGRYKVRLEPPLTTRQGPLRAAEKALVSLQEKDPSILAVVEDEAGPVEWTSSLQKGFAAPDSPERRAAATAGAELCDWLESRAYAEGTTVRLGAAILKCAAAIRNALPLLVGETPNDIAGSRLQERRPDFLLFQERERVLETEYNLDEPGLPGATPPALANLLALGDIDARRVIDAYVSGDITRISTLLKGVNRVLSERLQPTWRQSRLTVAVQVSGSMLQVLVDEVVGDQRTAIHERSDGLKTFIALVCFLARHRSDSLPVLLLDEAETHLHYDAQADLIEVLTSNVETSKVIYTTHSPGCLPPDLGTGIRLVAPDGNRPQSTLRNNFWDSNEPGFSPLLFAMGAGAAAFSVCRRAVLAEGPSDMILLPSLIRLAAGVEELGYQVAQGLSGVPVADLASAAIAAKVAYLVDGDAEGRRYRALLRQSGVEDARVFSLPEGLALEDLVALDCYVEAVKSLMSDAGWAGEPLEVAALRGSGTVASRLHRWCSQREAPEPGKTAVASRLVQGPDVLVLAPKVKAPLAALHTHLQAALA